MMVALAGSPLARAQEPVVGVKDPEALFRDKQDHCNKVVLDPWANGAAAA